MRTDRSASIDRIVRRGGDARGVLRIAAETWGTTLTELSRAIGRSPGYLARYVDRGMPAALNDNDQSDLSRYLGISADLLA